MVPFLTDTSESQTLLPRPPQDEDSSADCCSYWFCLGTSKDAQAKVVQTACSSCGPSCSCSSIDQCSHRSALYSSYDSFSQHIPANQQQPVSQNGQVLPSVSDSQQSGNYATLGEPSGNSNQQCDSPNNLSRENGNNKNLAAAQIHV